MYLGFSRVGNSYSGTIMVVVMVFTIFGGEEGTESAFDIGDIVFGQRLRRHGEYFALW